MCTNLGIYNLPGRRMYAGRGRDSIPGRLLRQMRRMDRHRPGCFLLLLCHHCAPPALCCCFSSLTSALSSAAALCALQIQNPPPHNAIHRFRHHRHQEQEQEDNKNKWWTLPFSHLSSSSSSLRCWLVGNLPVRRKREFLAFFLGWVSPLPDDAAAGCCVLDDRSNSYRKAGFLAQTLLYT